MTLPAAPALDLTLARCPTCDHEQLEIVTDDHASFCTLLLTAHCLHCNLAEPLGYVTRQSKYLFPWILQRWGVAL